VTDADLIGVAKTYITGTERGLVEDYFIARARDFAGTAAVSGFDAACTTFEVTKVDVPAFALNYKSSPLFASGSSVSELSGSSSDENFLKTVFALKEKEVSTPLVLGDNVVVLQVREVVDKSGEEVERGGNIMIGNGDGTTSTFSMAEFYMQQYEQSALSDAVKKDKKVRDNFDKTFDKFFPNDF
jgi:hypothetical protein